MNETYVMEVSILVTTVALRGTLRRFKFSFIRGDFCDWTVTGVLVPEKMVPDRFFRWNIWSPGSFFPVIMVPLWKKWSHPGPIHSIGI